MRSAIVLVALMWCQGAVADSVPEPADYRTGDYRAPVPATLSGGTVVGPDAALALWQEGAAFVDVLPRAPKPDNLPEGTIWRDKPRHSIPGAIWLPNVGYGALAAETEAYFRDGLMAVTEADRSRPVVFFCLAECWMSWNAARRAIEWGYDRVYWMPEGTDGWDASRVALDPLRPWQRP